MTVAYRGLSSRVVGTGATLVLTNDVPGLADGDMLLMVLHGGTNPATPPQAPAGWVLVDGNTSGNGYVQVWAKVAGSEPGTYTVAQGAGAKTYAAGLIVFYSTAGKSLYIDAHANQVNTPSANNRTFAGVTTTKASAGLLCAAGLSTNAQSTPPGDMTERYDELISTLRIFCMTGILTSAGATGDKIATNGTIASISRTVTVAVAEYEPIVGTAAITLDDVVAVASGGLPIVGSAAISLEAVSLVATAKLPIVGSAAITLGDVTLAGAAEIEPLPPTSVDALAIGAHSIEVTWQHDGLYVASFEIERSDDGVGGWVLVALPSAGERSYIDNGLVLNTEYFYHVRSVGN